MFLVFFGERQKYMNGQKSESFPFYATILLTMLCFVLIKKINTHVTICITSMNAYLSALSLQNITANE